MKFKRIYLVPIIVGTLLCGCTVVKKNEIKKDEDTAETNKGKFSIRADNDKAFLTLDTHSESDSQSVFLSDSEVPAIGGAYSYKWFFRDGGTSFSDIHNEYTSSLIGKYTDKDDIAFYKNTFFITNNDNKEVNYCMDIKLLGCEEKHMDEYIRVMIFEGSNKQTVYAKRSQTRTTNGKELIDSSDSSYGEAVIFDDNEIEFISSGLLANESRMCTLLFWLEGSDPELNALPEKTFLDIEATISGY